MEGGEGERSGGRYINGTFGMVCTLGVYPECDRYPGTYPSTTQPSRFGTPKYTLPSTRLKDVEGREVGGAGKRVKRKGVNAGG